MENNTLTMTSLFESTQIEINTHVFCNLLEAGLSLDKAYEIAFMGGIDETEYQRPDFGLGDVNLELDSDDVDVHIQ